MDERLSPRGYRHFSYFSCGSCHVEFLVSLTFLNRKIHYLYTRKVCFGLFLFQVCLYFTEFEYSPLKYRVYSILLSSTSIKAL